MRDRDLRAGLGTVEGDAPAPEFLAALSTEIQAELDEAHRGAAVLSAYPSAPVDDAWPPAGPVGRPTPTRRRARAGLVAAAAVVVVVVGVVVVVDPGGDGAQVVTTRLPHGYHASALPAAIVRSGDPGVVIEGDPTAGPDALVPAFYGPERSALDELGVVAALTVPFDLRVPGAVPCRDQRSPMQVGRGRLRCGSSSAALVFADDVDAGRALGLLATLFAERTTGLYQLGVVLERTGELDAPLGDDAEAFTLEGFVAARIAARVAVIVWRTDNLVQVLWDIQDRDTPGGTEALLQVARAVQQRTATHRQGGGADN